MSVGEIRFGIIPSLHNIPWEEIVRRWQHVEELGFDSAWVGDHLYNPFRSTDPFLDGWSLLAGLATQTSRIRIGTLVSNIIFRNPTLLAKQALTVDHISNGRLELGIGAGVFPSDHAGVGIEPWSARERVERFREVVEIVDGLLRRAISGYQGRYYRIEGVTMEPGPIQRPRPPLTLAAHGPKMLKIAAKHADTWKSWGGFGVTDAEVFLEETRKRNLMLDEYCTELGREPSDIRRSMLVYRPLDPWASVDAFHDLVGRYREIGISEFILYWPREGESMGQFEHIASEIMPLVRASASTTS